MTLNKLALALSLLLFAVPLSALAQDAPTESQDPAQATGQADQAKPEAAAPALTWNLSLTSDYVFRGITQTNFEPALQGGLDYSFGDSGLYVGAWASNVDFADSDGPDIELDSYVGWSHDVATDWNLDLSFVHYAYLGGNDAYGNVDYNEVIAKNTWHGMTTLTVAYAPDYANLGLSSWYVNLGGTWKLANEFALNAGVGHTKYSDGAGSYSDWNVGLSRQFGPVNAALNYYDTSGDTGYVGKASDRIVLTFAFGNGG